MIYLLLLLFYLKITYHTVAKISTLKWKCCHITHLRQTFICPTLQWLSIIHKVQVLPQNKCPIGHIKSSMTWLMPISLASFSISHFITTEPYSTICQSHVFSRYSLWQYNLCVTLSTQSKILPGLKGSNTLGSLSRVCTSLPYSQQAFC